MKKRFKFVMMCGLIFILIGALVTGAAYKYGKENYVMKLENYAQNFDIDYVNYINISGVTALVSIERGERFSVVAENFPENLLRCEIVDNALVISTNNSNGFFNIGFLSFPNFPSAENPIFMDFKSGWTESAKIYVYIPEGANFNEVMIEGNVGNVKADYVECGTLTILHNVGNVTVDDFSTDRLELISGVGNVNLSGAVSTDGAVSISGRVGNTTLNLASPANCDIDIDGGVGNTSLDIAGDIDDYNVYASNGIGTVRVNGVKCGTIDGYYEKSTQGAKYDINIDGGVGDVKVNIG